MRWGKYFMKIEFIPAFMKYFLEKMGKHIPMVKRIAITNG